MTAFVLDVSVTMGWFFEDEASDEGWDLLHEATRRGAAVPAIWAFELVNVLALAERRQRTTRNKSEAFLRMLGGIPIDIEAVSFGHLAGAVLPAARTSGLTAYDAAYLELAQSLALPLATKDRRMAEAARGLGVAVLP